MLIIEDADRGFRASVAFDRWDGTRAQYRWTIEAIGTDVRASGEDLRLGAVSEIGDVEAMRSLLGFFGAYAEAIEHERRGGTSDNADLFPATLRDLADALGSDEIAMIALDALGEEG